MDDKFSIRKKDILSKSDKSSIGGWDEKIKDLCDKINSFENYYTTSGCSGRVVLMIDDDEKKSGLFIKVWHDKISFEELKKAINEIMRLKSAASPTTTPKLVAHSRSQINKSINEDSLVNNSKNNRATLERVKFKMEPCILHVACKNLDDAQKLFDKVKLAGWKKSGIIASRDRIMLELNSTERLEFPIIYGGELLVDDKFLEIVVKKANEKLESSWKKIEKLRKLLE
tara:strand:- start:284 stop:967 length:684 start_codon:yes stop_codon:yes gene_type:complete